MKIYEDNSNIDSSIMMELLAIDRMVHKSTDAEVIEQQILTSLYEMDLLFDSEMKKKAFLSVHEYEEQHEKGKGGVLVVEETDKEDTTEKVMESLHKMDKLFGSKKDDDNDDASVSIQALWDIDVLMMKSNDITSTSASASCNVAAEVGNKNNNTFVDNKIMDELWNMDQMFSSSTDKNSHSNATTREGDEILKELLFVDQQIHLQAVLDLIHDNDSQQHQPFSKDLKSLQIMYHLLITDQQLTSGSKTVPKDKKVSNLQALMFDYSYEAQVLSQMEKLILVEKQQAGNKMDHNTQVLLDMDQLFSSSPKEQAVVPPELEPLYKLDLMYDGRLSTSSGSNPMKPLWKVQEEQELLCQQIASELLHMDLLFDSKCLNKKNKVEDKKTVKQKQQTAPEQHRKEQDLIQTLSPFEYILHTDQQLRAQQRAQINERTDNIMFELFELDQLMGSGLKQPPTDPDVSPVPPTTNQRRSIFTFNEKQTSKNEDPIPRELYEVDLLISSNNKRHKEKMYNEILKDLILVDTLVNHHRQKQYEKEEKNVLLIGSHSLGSGTLTAVSSSSSTANNKEQTRRSIFSDTAKNRAFHTSNSLGSGTITNDISDDEKNVPVSTNSADSPEKKKKKKGNCVIM